MTKQSFFRPAETAEHAGTILAWPTRMSVEEAQWSYRGNSIDETRANIAKLATTIAKYEPVHVFVRDPSMVFDDNDSSVLSSAQSYLKDVANVTIHVTPNVDSLWARDTGPMFVRTIGETKLDNTYADSDDPGLGFERLDTSTSLVGLQMNFNQWGRKEFPSPDSYFAATTCQTLGTSCLIAPFVAEGGAIETDEEGTFIATESSIINTNRNPGLSKRTIEHHLAKALGITKFIWIPGERGVDITDDHIDNLVRFTEIPGTLLLTRPYAEHENDPCLKSYHQAQEILGKATDAKGRSFTIVEIEEPDPAKVFGETYDPDSGVCVAYVNFLVGNGAVFMSKFGDAERDQAARETVAKYFPSRKVEQLELLQIGRQGGGIHCSTQHFFAQNVKSG